MTVLRQIAKFYFRYTAFFWVAGIAILANDAFIFAMVKLPWFFTLVRDVMKP